MRAVLFLNGDPGVFQVSDLQNAYVICADGAYNYIKNILKPDLLVGDFDSIHGKDLPKEVETISFPVKKDYTDGQLAVRIAAERGAKTLRIYGALGGRPDQVMVNYSLLKLAANLGIEAHIISDDYTIYFLCNQEFCGNAETGKIISVVPYGDSIHILSTEGLMYEANDLSVDNALIISVSNQALGGKFSVRVQGDAFLYVER